MYNTLKKLIPAGGYRLSDMQNKVKKLYLLGDLTDEQMDDLLADVSRGISPDAERPEDLVVLRRLAERVDALELKVAALEGETDDTNENAYETWEPWDGVSNKYQHGMIVSHFGKLWISEYSGQNVWEPGTPGTQGLWAEYEEES